MSVISNFSDKMAKIERVVFYLIVIFIALLLSTSNFLPMIDLPQHAGQVSTLKSFLLNETSAPWFDDIELNYLTTYWTAYGMAALLSLVFPINYAVNTVVGLTFLSFIISFSILRRMMSSKNTNILDWVLLPSFFGFAYTWGFLTFLLAIPVGVLLVIQNLKLIKTGHKKYFIFVILCGVLLYFSHMLVFLFFCLIASSMTIVNNNQFFIRQKLKQLTPFYLLFLFIPLFFFTSAFYASNELGKYNDLYYAGASYGVFENRLYSIFLYPWSIEKNNLFPLEIVSIMLIILPFVLGLKLSKDYKKYVPFVIFLVIWFALPEQVVRTAFVQQRFSIFLFPFYILLFESRSVNLLSTQKVLYFIWCCLSLLLLSLPMIDLVNFNRETKDFSDALNKIPSHKRMLGLVYDPRGSLRQGGVYIYFPSWYQAKKEGWVDFNFAWFSPQIIRYKSGHIPEALLGFAWYPKTFIKFKYCDKYEVLFVQCSQKVCESHEQLMQKSTCSHKIIYKNETWSVYNLEK
ncbi:hypothetical protein DM558_15600 [Entomomonas moraniae]|uniref:Glycosyltransferase RgtA/B/C/D-like domain-containing protein n=1 Tax=Entomomonas moraniae TaxID=2213226 RepID=A0A3Q9JL79_9GAMM|nr:hypothetical protein [Entomomonas moraniae]AZS52109.1 hypothetical protein DM558_15600 [Entomomonas moraniae]